MLPSLGLLVLTGMLWGCSNPFIRRGTKGLRAVKANGILAQAYAEIIFLLGNWRYVVPFAVNQCGSLAYLAAVQRAPLSVAVPTSNGLAFAFTAVTGATVGAEEPLDRGEHVRETVESWVLRPPELRAPIADREGRSQASILGIALIVVGTAFCCLDKSY